MHDFPALLAAILETYALSPEGPHGVAHWARVMENGLAVAQENGADAEVVRLFALFHDSRRRNDKRDDGHGLRGGEFAKGLRGRLIHLDEARFALLYDACRLHTDGLVEADPTLQACWDADRLDLGRVGIVPRPERLCTDAARARLDWAHARASKRLQPAETLAFLGWDSGK